MIYVLLTRAPLYRGRSPFSCDLHVLGAPLTFVLSQDQTLMLGGPIKKQTPAKLKILPQLPSISMDYYPMEEAAQRLPWQWQRQWRLFSLLSAASPAPVTPPRRPASHVSWEETAAAHLFSANLPGVRKEEIRVEVEDARYLVIRTELELELDDAAAAAEEAGARSSFDRKFRLPRMVDVDGISAAYTHGVLTVTVPRMHTRARPVVGLLGAGPTAAGAA